MLAEMGREVYLHPSQVVVNIVGELSPESARAGGDSPSQEYAVERMIETVGRRSRLREVLLRGL